MNALLPPSGADALTMSSREIAELLDTRHDSVKRTIERLAADGVIRFTPMVETSHEGAGARPVEVYSVGERDSYVVVARLSPEFTARLVDFWQAHRQPTKALTQAEMFLQNAQAMVALERQQAEHKAAIVEVKAEIAEVRQAQTVLSKCPSNAEPISHIRERIGKSHGLSASVIDAVMRQTPYAPKPAGMVRNDHAEAQGSTYAVYWQKDVTAVFDHFVTECVPVTPTMFTHPFVDGRFRIGARS